MGVMQKFMRNNFEEFLFDFVRGFSGRQPGTVGDPEHMGIDGDRRFAECDIENNICRFASNAR